MTTDESHLVSFRRARCDDRDYDSWLDFLTEMSARLDVLQTAVTELRQRCESKDGLYATKLGRRVRIRDV